MPHLGRGLTVRKAGQFFSVDPMEKKILNRQSKLTFGRLVEE
jgi:hypothetical protein